MDEVYKLYNTKHQKISIYQECDDKPIKFVATIMRADNSLNMTHISVEVVVMPLRD